jgi:hypothetical protein
VKTEPAFAKASAGFAAFAFELGGASPKLRK